MGGEQAASVLATVRRDRAIPKAVGRLRSFESERMAGLAVLFINDGRHRCPGRTRGGDRVFWKAGIDLSRDRKIAGIELMARFAIELDGIFQIVARTVERAIARIDHFQREGFPALGATKPRS